MNTHSLVAAAVLAVIGTSAFAGEAAPAPAPLTRAEVQAEFLRARAAGEIESVGDSYGLRWASVATRSPAATVQATRSREAVREEARAAARDRKHGDLHLGG